MNHYIKCNYCREVKPAEQVKTFKCLDCIEKDKNKANNTKDKKNG